MLESAVVRTVPLVRVILRADSFLLLYRVNRVGVTDAKSMISSKVSTSSLLPMSKVNEMSVGGVVSGKKHVVARALAIEISSTAREDWSTTAPEPIVRKVVLADTASVRTALMPLRSAGDSSRVTSTPVAMTTVALMMLCV